MVLYCNNNIWKREIEREYLEERERTSAIQTQIMKVQVPIPGFGRIPFTVQYRVKQKHKPKRGRRKRSVAKEQKRECQLAQNFEILRKSSHELAKHD